MTTLRLPRPLWEYADGARELSVAQPTLREALHELKRRHPLVYDRILTEQGNIREHVNIFVNRALVRDPDKSDPLKAGDTITVLPAISGG